MNKLNIEYDEIENLKLLTNKPILFVVNVNENDIIKSQKSELLNELEEYLNKRNEQFLNICTSLEQEISGLDQEEQIEYLKEFQLNEPVLNNGGTLALSGDEPNIVLNVCLLNEPLTIFSSVSSLNQGVCINKWKLPVWSLLPLCEK